MLESLAELPFPVNAQIYHDASVARVYPDGRRETEPATIVEFPAYAARLADIRGALATKGFNPESAWAKNMLDQIHAGKGGQPELSPFQRLLTLPDEKNGDSSG